MVAGLVLSEGSQPGRNTCRLVMILGLHETV